MDWISSLRAHTRSRSWRPSTDLRPSRSTGATLIELKARTSPASCWWCAAIRAARRGTREEAPGLLLAATRPIWPDRAGRMEDSQSAARRADHCAARGARHRALPHGQTLELTITDTALSWRRRDAVTIAAEAALDGLYVIRTSLPEQLDAGAAVAA